MVYLELPRLQFQANEIHRGQFPLWDPRIWAGQPLIGQTQPGPLYPFNLLFAALPLTNGYIRLQHLNWYWIFIHFQAALFCYWLARDLGRSRMAATVAACLFSFAGFVGTAAWLDVVNGAVWTPLVVLFLLRAVRGESPIANAILGGFSLGVAWLSGHHEIPLLVTYAAAFTWLHAWYRDRRNNWKPAAAFFAVLFLASAAQTLPTYEFGRISRRWIGLEDSVGWKDTIPYIAQTGYSMPVRGILGLALFGVNQADSSTFIGAIGLGLAILGIAAAWDQRQVRWFALLAGIALLYALGAATPLQGLFYSLAPLLDKARVPIRAIHLVHFALAALAAYGIDWLSSRKLAYGWLAFGIPIAAASAFWDGMDDKVLLTGWMAVAAGCVVLAMLREAVPRHAANATILVLILVELTSQLKYPNRYGQGGFKFVKAFSEHDDVARWLKMQPWPHRSMINDSDVPMNFGDWHGIDMLQGYVAGATKNLLLHGLHTPETRNLFAVTYWVSREPERPDQEEVYKGASGLKVFRNPKAMPRAWTAHEAVTVPDNLALQKLIHDPAFSPARTVAMLNTEAPRLETCEGTDEVKILRHHSNRITIRVELRCRGMLNLADTFYPGWRATVDGKPAAIVETYGALRGVVVEGGAHEIEFRFQPWSVYAGGWMTILATIIAGAAWRRA